MNLQGINWLESLAKWDGINFVPLEMPTAILSELGNPQNSFSSIHIAGTNGKGSTAAYIEGILVQAKKWKKIAKTISPHALSLTEVACVNGKEASIEEIDFHLNVVRETCERLSLNPSQYVALLVATFCLFKEKKVEVAIVEAGLGGRFDATNVLSNKILNIITSIGLEHEEQLGSTLKEIAWHKAGIVNSNVPCIVGEVSLEVLEVIDQHAFRVGSEVIADCRNFKRSKNFITFRAMEITLSVSDFEPSYIVKNKAVSAVAACVLGIDAKSIKRGLNKVQCPGRFEVYRKSDGNSEAIIDVAHNADGILELFSPQCLKYYQSFKEIKLVVSFLRRKNWKKMLLSFVDILDSKSELILLPATDECISLNELTGEFPNLKIRQVDSVQEVTLKRNEEVCIFFGTITLYEHFVNWAQCQKLSKVNVH